MKHNTAVEVAYFFLATGIHLREIKRFLDVNPSSALGAGTIPAPSMVCETIDPSTSPTEPASPLATKILPIGNSLEVWSEYARRAGC